MIETNQLEHISIIDGSGVLDITHLDRDTLLRFRLDRRLGTLEACSVLISGIALQRNIPPALVVLLIGKLQVLIVEVAVTSFGRNQIAEVFVGQLICVEEKQLVLLEVSADSRLLPEAKTQRFFVDLIRQS